MRSYLVLLDGGKREERVDVREVGGGRYEVTLRGEVLGVDAFRADPATMSLLVGEESYAVQLDPAANGVRVHVREEVHALDVLDERRVRLRDEAGGVARSGLQVVAAPMPGKVVKVLAAKGDAVRAGQGLVVIAAMKMENVIKSPKDGKLVELNVAEGQAVEGGARIAAVE